MTRETKFGLLLVLVLTSVFGVLIYKRIHQPAGLQAEASGPELETSEDADPFGDPTSASSTKSEVDTAPVEDGPDFGGPVIQAVAETPKAPAKPTVKPTKPKLPTNLDVEPYNPPLKTSATTIQKMTGQPATTANSSDPFGVPSSAQPTPVKLPAKITPARSENDADPFGAPENTARTPDSDGFDPLEPSAAADRNAPAFDDGPATESAATSEFGEPDPLDVPAANRVQESTAESRTVITVAPRIIIQEEEEELLGIPFEPPTTPAKTNPGRNPDPAMSLGEDTYIVQPQDNFWTISKKVYGAGRYFQALTDYNAKAYPDPKLLKPGDVIRTPAIATLEEKHGKVISAVAPTTKSSSVQPADRSEPQQQPGFFLGTRSEPLYRIGPEDTLTGIARQNLGRSSRWVQIFEMNRDVLKNSNALTVGTVLKLPADASGVRAVKSESPGR